MVVNLPFFWLDKKDKLANHLHVKDFTWLISEYPPKKTELQPKSIGVKENSLDIEVAYRRDHFWVSCILRVPGYQS